MTGDFMEMEDSEARDVPGVDKPAINEDKKTNPSESVPEQDAGGTRGDLGGGSDAPSGGGGASEGGGVGNP